MSSIARLLVKESIPHSQLAVDIAAVAPLTAPGMYHETPTRKDRRALLDAAALLGARVMLGFFKLDGTRRYMVCTPIADADGTCRHYTVLDLELTGERGSNVYRRVNLDSIVAVRVDYSVG